MAELELPSDERIVEMVRAHPYITSRDMAIALWADGCNNGVGEDYAQAMRGLRRKMCALQKQGIIISDKVQCCSFDLKHWLAVQTR